MSNAKGFKFCPFCGSKLRMGYPGAGKDEQGDMHEGDPESGPATPRCLENLNHGDPWEHIEDKAHEFEAQVIEDYLEEKSRGFRHDPWEPKIPDYVRQAAEVLQAHEHEDRVWIAKDAYERQRKTWYEAPWYGGECADLPPTRAQVYQHLTRRWPKKI